MKIVDKVLVIANPRFISSPLFKKLCREIEGAIKKVSWPHGRNGFYLNPKTRGKGRGEGNGVKPLKEACMTVLGDRGWEKEVPLNYEGAPSTGPIDAMKSTSKGLFAVEWETGNISSSHRAMNKMVLGMLRGELLGGALILPSNNLYPYLTDRVGNFRELEPYLPLWKSLGLEHGALVIYVVEQDGFDPKAPRIPKGTDGRALL